MTSSPAIVIVADDLTGAADCGIACTVAGFATVVVAFGNLERAARLDAEVIAFDTDTRRVPPDAAADLTAQAVARLCVAGATRVLYKKIDSTLRGNFAVEIAAARRAATGLLPGSHGESGAMPFVVVAPAFPATGRTTRGGRMRINGEPLEDSAVWRNEAITGVADLPAMLGAAGLRAESLPLESVRGDEEVLLAALEKCVDAGIEAVACDAETEADLEAIATTAARLDRVPLFAGSAGLARYLPAAFGLSPGTGQQPAPQVHKSPASPAAPFLFVVGSMSEVSRQGAAALAAEPGVQTLVVEPSVLRGGASSGPWRGAVDELEAALRRGGDVVLSLGLDEGINLGESAHLSHALAEFLVPFGPRLGGLFITGGETARALLNAAGAAGIRLRGEVEPGVPLGTAEGWRDLPVITKAGAFGHAGTLVRCRAALRTLTGRRSHHEN